MAVDRDRGPAAPDPAGSTPMTTAMVTPNTRAGRNIVRTRHATNLGAVGALAGTAVGLAAKKPNIIRPALIGGGIGGATGAALPPKTKVKRRTGVQKNYTISAFGVDHGG